MNWQVLVLTHTVLAAGATLRKRRLMVLPGAARAPLAMSALSLVVLYVCGLAMVPFLGRVDAAAAGAHSVPLIAAAVLFCLSSVCGLLSFAHLDSAVASIVSATNALFAVALAWLILGEGLSGAQLGGMLVLGLAVTYVLRLGHGQPSRPARRGAAKLGLAYGLLAGLLYGLALVVEKYSIGHMSMATYVVFGWGAQVVCAGALVLLRPGQLRALRNRSIVPAAALVGVMGAAGGACFIAAQIASGNVSLVSAVSNLRIVLVAVLAGWLLHERQHYYRRLAAAGVAVAGISLAFWP